MSNRSRIIRLLANQLHFFELLSPSTPNRIIDSTPRFTPEFKQYWGSEDEALSIRWRELQKRFFPERIDILDYEVRWSTRTQKRVLGSCNLTHQRIRIARAMDRPELSDLLEALLHHEMCHVVVGARKSIGGRRIFHGIEFKSLERTHPHAVLLDNWMKAGGWQQAVRSYASHIGHLRRMGIAQTYKREK
jgi:SprT-like family